ncbi:S9 family peptidase [Eilatimonas milleporae]|uniref:Dipeptidyl aminopeptidase/acylaminoacyl peptidase n=1 Tax=Eilatimonas milleporae TaxID=911205 RepID=A0A3M0CJQ1_9PROT|nr:S9 family peptidase [Eilatimonas milleporae]RMB08640.1 dipeptidyl aminopeptidase/acylaminoacyl peptidase [Eilatimonas milleporae]
MIRSLALLGLAAGVLAACGQPAQQEKQTDETRAGADRLDAAETVVLKYSAQAFYETTSFSASSAWGHAFSPDGSSTLISSDETGVFNAYAVDLASGTRSQLTTSTTSAAFGVSYFPRDGRILYTQDGGGDELNHVYVREADGSVRDLTPGEKVKASFAGWTADGGHFYLATNERDAKAFDLYRYAADGYAREMLFENTDALQISAISRDSRWLALKRPRTSADSDVLLVDMAADGATPQLITAHEGNIAYGVYGFTPDGAALILSSNERGEWNEAWAYDLTSGEKTPYVSADWDVSFVGFSSTGRYRYVGVNEDAQTIVTITDLETGRDMTMPDLPAGNVQNTRFSPDDGRLTFMLNGDTSPSDLYVMDLPGDAARRLTTALNPAIDQDHLVEATVVRYDSFDGVKIPSILYRPKGASAGNKVPALVLVHGGPGGQTRRGYRAMVQHLVNHGYAVLGANNRGSSGYGKTFYHMDDKRHGEEDLQDIVWGRRYLESLDWVDGDKVGIIGGSYGGFMVAAALAFEPDAFDVGIDIFGVTNWVRTLKSIPPWWESFRESLYDEMGDPATDEERHRRISPLFHAENITKPLLVIQGANDPRVLKVESDEIVEAVSANGVPVEYIVFPDEGHGFRSKANRITASDAYVRFLDTYLKGETVP